MEFFKKKLILRCLTPLAPAPQKSHTHCSKSSAKADKLSDKPPSYILNYNVQIDFQNKVFD